MIKKIIELKNNAGLKKYLTNTSWLFVDKIFRMIVSLFLGIWVARYLGVEQFGLLNYVISFFGIFSILATMGIDYILIKKLVENKELKDKLLGTSLIIKFFGSILLFFTLSIFIQFTTNNNETNMYIYILSLSTIVLSFNVIESFYKSILKSKYIAIASSFTLLITSIIKICLIVFQMELIYFILLIALEAIIFVIGLLYFYISHNNIFNWSFDFRIGKEILKESWPLILVGFTTAVYLKIDQIMIKEILGLESAGYYAAAVRISEIWYFIPIVISTSLFPALINARKISNDLYLERLKKLLSFLVWLAILIALPMSFLSDNLINLLFGKEYTQAGPVLMIHIWTAVFVFLSEGSNKWFINENLQKYIFYRTFTGAILNIIFNYLFIKNYGIIGAAYATLISQCISVYLINLFMKKSFTIFKLQTFAFIAPFTYGKKFFIKNESLNEK